MKKPTGKIEVNLIDQVNDFFEQNEEIRTDELDTKTLLFLIVHCLNQCIFDSKGNKPFFTMSQNSVFLELDDVKFSIDCRNNSSYQ